MKQSKRAWKKRNKWETIQQGTPSKERDKRLQSRKRVIDRRPPVTREVIPSQEGFESKMVFNIHELGYWDSLRASKQLLESIKQLTTGRYKVVKYKAWSYRKDKVVKSVLLENSSDVLILMMCHREYVKKIYNFDENKAPNGALFLSSSGFDDSSSLPEMLTCVA